ncbi:MAG: tetratricopeptide repeat protein [Flavobacteriales bacterium]
MRIFHLLLFVFFFGFSGMHAQPGSSDDVMSISKEEQLAAQYLNEGAFEKAADVYEKLFNKRPETLYYNALITCYSELKDVKSAEKLIGRLAKRFPEKLSYQVDLAYIINQSGDKSKAQKLLDKAMKDLNPTNDDQVIDLANAFLKREHPDRALKVFQSAKKAANRIYNFQFELATLYFAINEYDAGFSEWIDLLGRISPQQMEKMQHQIQDLMIADEKGDRIELFKTKLLREAQKNPDNFIFSELLIWIAIQQKDFETAFIQTRAIDRRLRENGFRMLELARLCAANDAFDVAEQAYRYMFDKSLPMDMLVRAKIELPEMLFRKVTESKNITNEELASLEDLLQKTYHEFKSNELSIPLAIKLAKLQAFYLDKTEPAVALLEGIVEMRGVPARPQALAKMQLADVMLLSGDIWEASLLYSQVDKAFKNDTLGQEAKFRNARLAYFKGEFDWAKAQLDVLKSATSKLIANDALELSLLITDNTTFDTTGEALRMFSRADLWLFQNKPDEALKTLDSLQILDPQSTLADDILYRKAQIDFRKGRYTQAIEHLEKLLMHHKNDILADNAVFMMAEIYERKLNDTEKAQKLYKELMVDYPGSLYVVEARKRYRMLRGDLVN